MLTRRAAAIALVLLVVGVVPVGAHHGWSGYDATKEMTLTGTIKEAGYEHPHGHVRLEVPGKVWLVVLAPPTRMESRGLPAAKLRVGGEAPGARHSPPPQQGPMRA